MSFSCNMLSRCHTTTYRRNPCLGTRSFGAKHLVPSRARFPTSSASREFDFENSRARIFVVKASKISDDTSNEAPLFEDLDEPKFLKITLTKETAKQTILLDQVEKDGGQKIFVSAVGTGSEAEEAGVQPGQILLAMSHPTKVGDTWNISGTERLRYVRDGINLRRSSDVSLFFTREPLITADDVTAAAGTVEAEAGEQEAAAAAEAAAARPRPSHGGQERDREDLYSANWDGDQYRGSNWNVLTVGLGLAILVPILGLGFAAATYGTLWGTSSYVYLPF
mmetsp:Transcript_19591/g.46774  ORF Transcript_19591/g.46774 Transcript_19591/m.46774 type:complete len:280 (+) Transcript_19591:80-919(+)